jgi:hypothetical protein
MKRLTLAVGFLTALGLSMPAFADVNVLNNWCVTVNGDSSACNGNSASYPITSPVASGGGSVDLSSFDQTLSPSGNSLGSITVTLGAGSDQFVNVYMDYDLNYPTAGSFQDLGATAGTLSTGESYELDDPNNCSAACLAAPAYIVSDIELDSQSTPLPDTNTVGTAGTPPNQCCDVSWALGLGGINVLSGGSATVTFTVSTTQPTSGFYLQQTNEVDSGDVIYLSGSVTVNNPVTGSTPEPGTWLLLSTVIGGIAMARKKFMRSAA